MQTVNCGLAKWSPCRCRPAEQRNEIVVPRSAVIWDGMGSACVYVVEPEQTFRRQRIRVGTRSAMTSSSSDGLAAGQSVVTVGAEALYGEEFKGQVQVLDDD